MKLISAKSAVWVAAIGLAGVTAWAATCNIVGNIQKRGNTLSFTSNRTTVLRLSVANRGWVNPSHINAQAGHRYTVQVSGYPVHVTDMDGNPRGCNNQDIP